MTYKNKICDRCGITHEQFYKIHPNRKGEDFYMNYNPLDSFFIGANDSYWCGPCHEERDLEQLFSLMDEIDKRRKKINVP
jgi:hypothetical protein